MTIQNELKKANLTFLSYVFLTDRIDIQISLCKGNVSKSISYLFKLDDLKRAESYEDMFNIISNNSDKMYIVLSLSDCEKIGYDYDDLNPLYAEIEKFDIMKAFFNAYKYTNLFSKFCNTEFHVHEKGYSGLNTWLFSGTLSEIDKHFDLNYETDKEVYPTDLEAELLKKHPLGKHSYYFINEKRLDDQ